jgi:broad specificity phosphatase PhoE
MAKIMLIRHGETDWNVKEIFRGQMDVPLNETGISQAKLLAEYLKDIQIEAIYSSPLQRALRTADIIADYHQMPVKIADGLTDFNYGKWQGLSRETVKERYPGLYEAWLNNQLAKVPGGESLDNVRARSLSLVKQVVAKYSGIVALVSHRVTNKVLICALLGLNNSHFWNIKLDNCGITTFLYENRKFILDKHNDISFLKPLGRPKLSGF